jgi:predicted RNA-binding Zn ribbon-like protein
MSAPTTPDSEFRFGLGHVALEFVATLAGRFRSPHDRLATPADLERWLREAGILESVRCDEKDLGDARELREAIYRLVDAGRAGASPTPKDLELINRWAREPTPAPQVGPTLELVKSDAPFSAALSQLARSAADLVTGPGIRRVRNCADPTCSLFFIDNSRPGRRRWCSMERCGNKSKTARYRHRHPRATA